MHNTRLSEALNAIFSIFLKRTVVVDRISAVRGGSINSAYKVEVGTDAYFVKINNTAYAEAMFRSELDGLYCLREFSGFSIPAVYGIYAYGTDQFLIMDFINSAARSGAFWDVLGANLAKLHRNTQQNFGYQQSNFIGSLPQRNTYHASWIEFFSRERIAPMLNLALKQDLIDQKFIQHFNAALNVMLKLIPEEPPALLHGDLWSGNLMTDEQGMPTLIDPAVYFGHREMDIAFTHLFGGFAPEFYEAYNHYYPLETGFEERIDIHNLYPLLVHLNLFGKSYLPQIKQIINRFT